jgi:hypothetical protein
MPSFRVTQLAARRAKPVEHRPTAIDRKAVHGEQMLYKAVGIAALEVTDRTAPRALFVKMRVAVTRSANVLINASPPVVALKFSNRLVAAKIAKMTVDTAPALLGIPVDGKAKLLCRKLTVGIARKVVDQSLPPHRFVSLFLHKKTISSKLRIILKL